MSNRLLLVSGSVVRIGDKYVSWRFSL